MIVNFLVRKILWLLKEPMLRWDNQEKYLFLLGLLGEEHSLDVRQNTTLGNGDARQQLVELFIVTDGKLQVTGDDTGLLVVTGGVTCQFQNFSGKIFHHSCQIYWCSSANTFCIISFTQKAVNSANRELKAGPAGAGLGLSLDLTTLTTTRHDACLFGSL